MLKLALWAGLLAAVRAQRPNVILVLADDLGFADVDWHDPNLSTPNLRKLAFSEHSAYLTNSYVSQLCTPSRAALMTGVYPFRTGTQDGVFLHMEPSGVPLDFPFLPQMLSQMGYRSYLVGKWHLGYCKTRFLPTKRGFDYFFGYYGAQQGYFNHSADIWDRNSKKVVRGLDLFEEIDGKSRPVTDADGVYSPDLFTGKAIELMKAHNSKDPFFLFLSFQSVHAPLQVPTSYRKRCASLFYNHKRQLYCGMLAAMDDNIGYLVDFLKSSGLYNNTVIMFSSDNGGDTKFGASNKPYRGEKNSIWEGGTKTNTFFHSVSHIKNFTYIHELFHIVDWPATIMGIAGSTNDSYGDGLNQWPLVQGNSSALRRNQFVYNINQPTSAIRRGRFKLVYSTKNVFGHDPLAKSQLFKLTDPLESKDLSKKYPQVVSELVNQIKQFALESRRSVRKPLDPRGNPELFGRVYMSGWC